ncbi:MAG: pyruvate ferredoxin oxidoreductase [Nanoarchaeota archaeon]|nr:pyruvate ferredoxin oxidoreductase [Nanoarchaeota archaeon]
MAFVKFKYGKTNVISGSDAIAIGIKLARPEVLSVYPITPQTIIAERLAQFVNNGELDAEMIRVEGEHSAISAAIGSQATGVRTISATSSQGLALMHEVLFTVSGMRLPIIMPVANRALSAPINIWNDHQDSISQRDAGWIQLYVESGQEALDTAIQAFKIGEDHEVLLPVMICLDGFQLTHVYEPVNIPSQKLVDSFLPKYNPFFKLDPKKPVTMGPVGGPDSYMELRKDLHEAMLNSAKIIKKVNDEFAKKFGRSYGDGLIETYKSKDAETLVICIGGVASTAREVIDDLRKKGLKAGMVRIKCYRPFPSASLEKACVNAKNVAVIDRNISLGASGAVYNEVKALLPKKKVSGFIMGLGGRDVKKEHIAYAIKKAGKKVVEWVGI